jgi:hypothetical protein
MSEAMKIAAVAEMPDELVQDWLQHMGNFTAAHPDCTFKVIAATARTIDSLVRNLNIDPPRGVKVVMM